MPFQPRLPDFFDTVTSNENRGYFTRVRLLRGLVDRTPLLELRRLQSVSKQALNRLLHEFEAVGWVEHEGYGVWEVTKKGKNWLDSISGTSNHEQSDGGLPVIGVRAAEWLSVHFFKVKFNLKGEHFDKTGLQKNARNRWVEYSDAPPTTLECRKRCLTVTVHGLKGGDAQQLASVGLERAREVALAFCARRGARVFSQGEFSGMPHWVVEELNTSKELKALLGLASGRPPVRLAGLEWYVDRSHGELVEARGELETAKTVFKNFGYLLDGSLKRDLELVRSELGNVKVVAEEVRLLREELRFKPSGAPRIDVS